MAKGAMDASVRFSRVEHIQNPLEIVQIEELDFNLSPVLRVGLQVHAGAEASAEVVFNLGYVRVFWLRFGGELRLLRRGEPLDLAHR